MKRVWRIRSLSQWGLMESIHRATSLNAVKRMCKRIVNSGNMFWIIDDQGHSHIYLRRPTHNPD